VINRLNLKSLAPVHCVVTCCFITCSTDNSHHVPAFLPPKTFPLQGSRGLQGPVEIYRLGHSLTLGHMPLLGQNVSELNKMQTSGCLAALVLSQLRQMVNLCNLGQCVSYSLEGKSDGGTSLVTKVQLPWPRKQLPLLHPIVL
jgi:hypothetical protein